MLTDMVQATDLLRFSIRRIIVTYLRESWAQGLFRYGAPPPYLNRAWFLAGVVVE